MVRRRLDVLLVGIGATILIPTAVLAKRGVYGWEATAFRSVNDLPDAIQPVVWVFNQ